MRVAHLNPLFCHPAQTLDPPRPNPITAPTPATEIMLATVEGQGLLRGGPRARRTALLAAGHAPTNMLLLPPVSEVPLPNYSNNSCKNSSLFKCCNMHGLERNLLCVHRWQCVCRTSTCSLLVLLVNLSKSLHDLNDCSFFLMLLVNEWHLCIRSGCCSIFFCCCCCFL
jgi:hypothetical protein